MAHAIICLIVEGCISPSDLILENVTVSMTHARGVKGQHLVKGNHIEDRWCPYKDPILAPTPKGSKQCGFVDEVVYKAQQFGEGADFIVNADIYLHNGCAKIIGTQARLVDDDLESRK